MLRYKFVSEPSSLSCERPLRHLQRLRAHRCAVLFSWLLAIGLGGYTTKWITLRDVNLHKCMELWNLNVLYSHISCLIQTPLKPITLWSVWRWGGDMMKLVKLKSLKTFFLITANKNEFILHFIQNLLFIPDFKKSNKKKLL